MLLALQVPENWTRLGVAAAAILGGLLAVRLLTRALARAPSATGWLILRIGFGVAAFGALLGAGIVPNEPMFPAETLGIAVGALMGGGLALAYLGRSLSVTATRFQTNHRVSVPVRPVAPASETAFTLPAGGGNSSGGRRTSGSSSVMSSGPR